MHREQLDSHSGRGAAADARRRRRGSWRRRWRRELRLLALRTGMAFPAAKFMGGSGKRARASCRDIYDFRRLRCFRAS